MRATTFSVIIPAYNAERTIVATVTACLQQSYPPQEIIVVNDCSTDGTEAALLSAFDEQIIYRKLAQNSGPSAARNAGLALATGAYIAFQDADDLWHREKLAHIARVLEIHPEIRFLYHPYTLGAVDFEVLPQMIRPQRFPVWKLLLSNPIAPHSAMMLREASLHFNERMRYMEDYELFLREAQMHGVYRIDAPFTQVGRPILSKGGLSGRRWKMRTGEIWAWWLFAKRYPQYLPALPLLIVFGLVKHIVKSLRPPRTNY